MSDEEYNRVPPVPVGTFMMIPKSEWAESRAAQVAVLREALTKMQDDTFVWSHAAPGDKVGGETLSEMHAATERAQVALVATAADFDCIVEVVKAAVGVQLAPDDNAEIWIAAEKALRKAVKALTPKAREMLR